MPRDDTTWEDDEDRHARRRDDKRRPRMPVSGASVLLLSRLVRTPSRKGYTGRKRRATPAKASR